LLPGHPSKRVLKRGAALTLWPHLQARVVGLAQQMAETQAHMG